MDEWSSCLDRRHGEFIAFFCAALMCVGALAESSVQSRPEVRRYLDYQLPVLDCTKPKFAHSQGVFSSGKNEVVLKAYGRCLETHGALLKADFAQIESVVHQGVSPDEAKALAQKMFYIARAIRRLGGLARAASNDASNHL